MTEFVVLSGKGGTGKTSIAASLAFLAGTDAIIADCDVDAANMHILLRPDYNKTYDFFGGELASLNQELCIQCGKCAEVCRFKAILIADNKFMVNDLDCEGCGYCESVCPAHSITLHERKTGNVYISNIKTGSTMVHARMNIGAENSGKLVARVKNEAMTLAIEQKKQFIIADGAPGIGCPVVSSLSGAHYVILVTEPTISGLHDLKRVFEVIQKFRIRAGCIINKYDLNNEKTSEIMDFLIEKQIQHLGNIQYDINFSSAMVAGKTIVEFQSPLHDLLKSIWVKIITQATN